MHQDASRPHATPPVRVGARRAADPEWYKDAVLYELHVRSFQDSNADGIGDFPGLTRRLPYLRDLGVSALWLLPFYPSPLRDDGYDIADYLGIHPDYGTLEQFDTFLQSAHRHGLRVFTELVINHTSDQHQWFERARRAAPGTPERNFYVWSETPERYAGTRIIFQDFERSNWSWDPIAGAYYWHRFYSHQPDLNYRNPAVLEAVLGVIDFWLARGVDGMRLDAVPYLLEEEGTSSENLAQTHAVLKGIRAYVDERFPGRAFIAEANQWPEDAVAYFGRGDESHMVFHFPLMPRLFMAVRQEDRLPLVDILAQTPAPPPSCQWALFLRNHDELTLEMVTEEERLYMYHVFASDPAARINLGIRRRLAPLLGNDRRRIELMNALLFSLPGTPVIYYGDEIGMGDNIYLGDRDGVRTPMQWDGDRNAGFSAADPQRLFLPLIVSEQFHHQTCHVALQDHSAHSLLRWMRRIIAQRKRHQAFGRGDMTLLSCPNPRVFAFIRSWRDERILIVANLSRFAQYAALDLSAFTGSAPIEMFGRNRFPPVGDGSYPITLGPYACLWFELEPPGRSGMRPSPTAELTVTHACHEIFHHPCRADLEALLARVVESRLTTFAHGRPVLAATVLDRIELATADGPLWPTFVRADYSVGEPQGFMLLLRCQAAGSPLEGADVLADVAATEGEPHALVDAMGSPSAVRSVLDATVSAAGLRGGRGRLHLASAEGVPDAWPDTTTVVLRERPAVNTVLQLGRDYVVKLYRHVEVGEHPEVEMGRALRAGDVRHVAPLVAALEYEWNEGAGRQSAVVGIIHRFVPNEGEAWTRSVRGMETFLERACASGRSVPAAELGSPLRLASPMALPQVDQLLDGYAGFLDQLAERVSGLHRALAGFTDAAFAPEPFNTLSRRSVYQHVRTRLVSVLEQLRLAAPGLPTDLQPLASRLHEARESLLGIIGDVLASPLTGRRIRCHGNLHLGQVLHVENDLCIIDFEGEPGRPAFERRIKHTPLHDVVGILRSFAFVAGTALARRGADDPAAAAWSQHWQEAVSARFLDGYRQRMEGSDLLPAAPDEWRRLFTLSLVERIVHEIGSELETPRGNGWMRWPLRDLLSIAEGR